MARNLKERAPSNLGELIRIGAGAGVSSWTLVAIERRVQSRGSPSRLRKYAVLKVMPGRIFHI